MTGAPPPPAPVSLLMTAPNGARRTKADHPALPMAPGEIGTVAARCFEAGASALHLHVRDAAGRHSLDPGLYRAAITAVRREAGADMAVQVTSEAVGRYQAAEQMAMVRELRPEAVSLALREILPDPHMPDEAAAFLAWLKRERVAPQFILYAAEEAAAFERLRARGVVPQERPFVLYVLGRYDHGPPSAPAALLPFLACASADHPWAVCAFGREETACLAAAAALGGHVRVGFENNLHRADGTTAADNAERTADVAEVLRRIGRPPADPAAARALFATTA